MNPGGAGRGPYAPGGLPPPSAPPREHLRRRAAPRAGPGMPREPMPPRPDPPRDSRLLRDAGPPREGMGPGGPIRPGGPVPPRDPAYPPPPAPRQASGAARPPGGPGFAAPGRYRPDPGPGGSPGPAEPPGAGPGPFDGEYATVIRASEHPIRPPGPARPPGPGRLSGPARPVTPPADVYVYRDTDGDPGSAPAGPDENDPAYWYDLPGTGSVGAGSAGGGPHVRHETRGPFEPLVSSADPPAAPPRVSAGTDANVDKHVDQLLAQQHELISEYFKQSGQADTEPGHASPSGPEASAPEGARLAADQPRAW